MVCTATCGGIITNDGGAPVSAKGICWNTTGTPSLSDFYTNDGIGSASYNSTLSALLPETTYYTRAYATNSAGTGFGTQKVFTTPACPCTLPIVSSSPVSSITFNSASYSATVTDDGGCEITSRGFCRSSTGIPTIADNPIECGAGLGTFSCQDSGLEPETSYWMRAWAINSEGTAYSSVQSFATPAEPVKPDWEQVWEIPFSPMNFFVYKATIDASDMVAGDWIGLFDTDPVTGQEICVGKSELTAPLVGGEFLEILASMDDGTNPLAANGFTPGHEIIYKLWNPAKGEVNHVSANYPYPGFDEVYTALGTTLVELDGITVITQTFDLDQNWNLISFTGTPENPDMLNIFDPLITNGTLFKVLDQDGSLIIHLPVPPPNGMWFNSIGDLTITQGYYVKVLDATTFDVVEIPVDFPFEIPLHESWNMMAYPGLVGQDAMSIVQTLIDDGQLIKIIDDQGNTIVHLPFPAPNGQWVNTIGNFTPNEGYYINVNTETLVVIPAGTDSFESNKTLTFIKGTYFETANTGNPFMPMHLIFDSNEFLEDGDEVAAFDGGICVGSVQVIGGEPVIITAAADDPDTEIQEGFIVGNPISISILKKSTGEIIEKVQFTVVEGYNVFAALETMCANLDFIPTGIESFGNKPFCTIHPNPFNSSTMINLTLANAGQVNIQLFDARGNSVKTISSTWLSSGKNQVELQRDDLASGYYILQTTITSDGTYHQQNHKLIIH